MIAYIYIYIYIYVYTNLKVRNNIVIVKIVTQKRVTLGDVRSFYA